jgi:hypothetical protein
VFRQEIPILPLSSLYETSLLFTLHQPYTGSLTSSAADVTNLRRSLNLGTRSPSRLKSATSFRSLDCRELWQPTDYVKKALLVV